MIHQTAEVSPNARIGENVTIWHQAQVREGARIGNNCILGKGAYIDKGVTIGDNVKIQNYASVYHGSTIESGVFIGPYACILNDKAPRSVTPEGKLKRDGDWSGGKILIKEGASIGSGSIILPHVTIGISALVGAGSVVTRDVPDHAMVYGNPAKIQGFVCKSGHKVMVQSKDDKTVHMKCPSCGETVAIKRQYFVDE